MNEQEYSALESMIDAHYVCDILDALADIIGRLLASDSAAGAIGRANVDVHADVLKALNVARKRVRVAEREFGAPQY